MKGTDFVNAQNPKNPYQFTGQEFIDAGDLGWYDYGARWYDPAVGRMMQVDPMASSYDSWSTYTYGMDNPVRYVDPTGMFSVGFNQDDFWGPGKSNWLDKSPIIDDISNRHLQMGISKGDPVTDPPPKGAKENPFTLATATVSAAKGYSAPRDGTNVVSAGIISESDIPIVAGAVDGVVAGVLTKVSNNINAKGL
jgi:RHS repeat-associated protein